MAKIIKPCSEPGCQRIAEVRGMCGAHYQAAMKGGLHRIKTKIKEFWDEVEQSGGPDACWPWKRFKAKPRHVGEGGTSYGMVVWNGHSTNTHRVAWEKTFGPIPDGLWVLHRCDNPPCCNPAHLFLGTHTDNMIDRAAKGRHNLPRGGAHFNTMLTDDDIRKMFTLRDGGTKLDVIAATFSVTVSNVSMILSRKTWRHVKI